jgi:hypothetical protein
MLPQQPDNTFLILGESDLLLVCPSVGSLAEGFLFLPRRAIYDWLEICT